MSVTSPFSCNIVGKAQFCVGVTLMRVTALNTEMHSACLTPSAPLQASLYIRSQAASGFCFTLNPIYCFYTTKCNKSGQGSAFLGSRQINVAQIKRSLIKKGSKIHLFFMTLFIDDNRNNSLQLMPGLTKLKKKPNN